MNDNATQELHKPSATTVACYGCGTDLAPAQRTQVAVKSGKTTSQQPMCRTCAANHAAKQAFGGMYLSMASGSNRAARRKQAKAAPVVKPVKQRRATRGERRAAKKDAAKKDAAKKDAAKGKQVAA